MKYSDGEFSGVLKGIEVEHEDNGETLQEGVLEEGDRCMARWQDGKMYKAKVVLIAGKYEKNFSHAY